MMAEQDSIEERHTESSRREVPAGTELVRVRDYIPDIFVELRYATAANFTGAVIYDFTDAYLRYGTVRKLAAVQRRLTERGYSLKIWDAYRPASAQFALWDAYPDPVYVADPRTGHSSHSSGGTVDVCLVRRDGSPVELPTDFDDFSVRADRDYSDVSAAAGENARILEEAMAEGGFVPYFSEWWHFEDTDRYGYEDLTGIRI